MAEWRVHRGVDSLGALGLVRKARVPPTATAWAFAQRLLFFSGKQTLGPVPALPVVGATGLWEETV